MRALRLSALVPFVLTLAGTLTACGTPKATLKSDAGLDAAPDAHVVTVDRKAFPKVLNPPGPEGALFYAGSGERRITHPGVAAITQAARGGLFDA